jgi:recombination protein RecR
LGPKSATRLTFHILKRPLEEVEALTSALLAVKKEINFCSICHDYTHEDPCSRCLDPKRDRALLCVVESPNDLAAIESSGLYHGLYHVLGGTLNPLAGIGPDSLYIKDLLNRVVESAKGEDPIREVLLAMGSSPEGETTCSYLADLLKDSTVKVTKLARGLPAGMYLEFVDLSTLKQALQFRRQAQ